MEAAREEDRLPPLLLLERRGIFRLVCAEIRCDDDVCEEVRMVLNPITP